MLALQTNPSRQLDATLTPSVLTISTVQGGVRAEVKVQEGVPVTYNDPPLTA